MTEVIFGKEAAKYYEKGIPVMPLDYHEKKPTLPGWQSLATKKPDEATQNQWIANYPRNNIGLPLGKASGLCAVDIDSYDDKVVQAIKNALPYSPWERIGQKGMVLIFKYNDKVRNRNIKDSEGNMLFEIMSNGRQIVLPPSIHPKTKKPYVSNVDLVDVLEHIKELPENIEEIIREKLVGVIDLEEKQGRFDATKYISTGGRDNAMTALGGQTALEVRLGNITVLEGIDRIENWCEFNTEKVVGDSIDVEKGVNNFLGFLIRDVNHGGRILPVGWDKGLTDEQKELYGLKFTEEQKEWTYKEIMNYLKEQFETTAENSDDRREAIDFILRKVAKSSNMDDLSQARVIDYLHKHSGDGVKVSDYKREIKKITAGPLEGTDQTQIAKAAIEKFEDVNGPLRFVEGDFWNWCGDHWKIVEETPILAMIANEFGELMMAKRATDHKGVLKIMSTILPQKLTEKQHIGVNFINGFVDEKLELHAHKPEHGMTYVLPYRYMPDQAGNFPQFNQLLHGYWSEDEDYADKVMALQEAMCSTVLGLATRYQKAFLLYGVGSTGKSQLLNIISNLVPKEAKIFIKPDQFKDPYALITIQEKLLNVSGELHEKKKIDGESFKEVVSAETDVTARKPYHGFVSFKPKAAHWFSSNFLPHSNDTSEGFFRRWQVFEFTREIPDEEKILDFGSKIIAEEMEAIMAWAISCYPRLSKMTKYTEPKSHRRVMMEMTAENSSVRYFLNNYRNLDYTTGQTSADDLYKAYFAYIPSTGLRPVSTKKFDLEIKMMSKKSRKFDIIERNGETWYVGVKITG